MAGVLSLALVALMVATVPSLTSCTKNTEPADITDLLSKVPSSAEAVVGLNLRSMLEKAGCEVDGSKITPGEDLEQWIDGHSEFVPNQREVMKMVLSGESGVDPLGAVFFIDAYNTYLSAMIADTSKFEEFVKKQTGKTFEDNDGVKICGNIAMAGAQMWMALGSGSTVDAKAIKNYMQLTESQSFMENPFAEHIATMKRDIVGWGLTRAFMGKGMSIGDAATVTMATGMLFEDASALGFNIDFQEGQLESEIEVLNDKGDNAKYLLPAEKLDTDDIKGLATNAEAVVAVSVPNELIKKIEKVSSSLGGNSLGFLLRMIGCLDGTLAVATGDLDNPEKSLSGLITTDGKPSSDFMTLLSQFGNTQKDDKIVRVKSGTVGGGLEVEKAADYLKGATLGGVVNANASDLGGNKEGIKSFSFRVSPKSGSLIINVTVAGVNEKENMLMTLLKN